MLGAVARRAVMNKYSVYLMWHPKNHGDYFKDRITYELYPERQEAVDAIILPVLHRVHIICHPPVNRIEK